MDRSECAASLGQTASRMSRTAEGAETALALVRRAQGMIAPSTPGSGMGDPLYPKLRHVEAMARRTLGDPDHAAAGLDREAWTISLESAPSDAITFAAEWGDWAWARDLWCEAAEAYDCAHRAMRRFLLRQVGDEDERMRLLANTTYASRGAYALGKAGRVRDAIVLLERACDLVFARNADTSELPRLAAADPALKARFDWARAAKRAVYGSAAEGFGLDDFGNLTFTARAAQAEEDSVVFAIRALPGFETFARPSGWDDVGSAVASTPLAYLAPTDKGTCCWVLAPGSDRPVVVLEIALDIGIEAIVAAARPFIAAEFASPRADSRGSLDTLHDWLGRSIMAYVKAALIAHGRGDGPVALRVFGLLSLLPLHTATIDGESVFSAGAVTFAYSARSLVRSFARADARPATGSLIVDNPRPLPPQFDLLRLSSSEAAIVLGRVPGTVLAGPRATAARLIDALPAATLAHLICHGTVDSRIGYSGVLVLANFESLTYQHLRRLPWLSARLVVMSACRSGATGITVEHPVSLPAAFLAAGAVGVVGTFWHADEMASLLLVTRFYALWLDERLTPADALGRAQHWLATSRADTLRSMVSADILASPPGKMLLEAGADALVFAHPWFWAAFFLAGA